MRTSKQQRQEDKMVIIKRLEEAGVDFSKDPFCLDSYECELLRNEAHKAHYNRPEGSYFALGGAFFVHLKKFI